MENMGFETIIGSDGDWRLADDVQVEKGAFVLYYGKD